MIQKATEKINPIVMEIETDPVVCAEASRRKERYERNWDWLEAHAKEVYAHRGKYICIVGPPEMDMSFLGRDITNLLTLVVDRPGDAVCLLSRGEVYHA